MSLPETGTVFDINSIGAGVLRNNQQFINAGLNQIAGFLHDVINGPADQITDGEILSKVQDLVAKKMP